MSVSDWDIFIWLVDDQHKMQLICDRVTLRPIHGTDERFSLPSTWRYTYKLPSGYTISRGLSASNPEQTMLASALERRYNAFCSTNNYTAPNNLEFDTSCNTNIAGSDLVHVSLDSFDDCMDACSTHSPRCYGVSFNDAVGVCWMKNSTIASQAKEQEDNTHSAIADATQLNGDDTSCPYTDQSYETTTSGLTFQIYCNKDLEGSSLNALNWNYPYHADSLMDCMDLCAETHPLCEAVAWNPDMNNGYSNCYPKNSTTNLIVPSGYVSHFAIASFPSRNDTSCVDDSTYNPTSANSSSFSIKCNRNIANTTIETTHSTSLDDCVDACTDYSNATQSCSGVAYDSSMDQGYQNCYLKSDTGPISTGNYTIAIKAATTTNSTTTATNPTHNRSHAGVIAGATVGSIAGVLLLLFLLRLLKRYRNSSNAKLLPVHSENDGENHDHNARYTDTTNTGGENTPAYKYELQSQELQELGSHPTPSELGTSDPKKSLDRGDVGVRGFHELQAGD